MHARLFGLVEWFLAAVLSALLAILCLFEKLGLPYVSMCCLLPFFVGLGQDPQVIDYLKGVLLSYFIVITVFMLSTFYVPGLLICKERKKLKEVKSLLNLGWSDSRVHVILPFN